MKRLFILFLCSLYLQQVAAQATSAELSPYTKHYLGCLKANQNNSPIQGYIYRQLKGTLYIAAIIKVSDANAAQTGLDNVNALVGTKAGPIWTVQVPVDKVTAFTGISGISYIQLDEPLKPDLNFVRKLTRVDSVQEGVGLPMPYSGKGVVVGVIDFGFDYTHPTFFDTTGAAYRIKRVWEMEATGTPPTGYSYGKEITDTTEIKAEGTDNAKQFHGTATTGIAAGSGYGGDSTNRLLRGMAYGADIVLVGVRRDSIEGEWLQGSFSDFIDGLNYIFNYAASVGKPAVVNISWGSQSGAHDGTSLFNQACDYLSGPGKIIVMSAGNDGQNRIHLSKTFTPTDTAVKTYVVFTPANYQNTWIDAWGDTGKTFCASVTLFKDGVPGNSTGYVCIDDSVHNNFLISADGTDTCYVQFITSSAEINDKPRMTVVLYNKSTDSIGLQFSASSGHIDAWDEYYYFGYTYQYLSTFDSLDDPTAVPGDTLSNVSDMGSGQSVLLVGAYTSNTSYTDINGNDWSYNSYAKDLRLTPFSSIGPMADGRIKPDITAPGLTIATSVNSYDTALTATGSLSTSVVHEYIRPSTGHAYYYSQFDGTSASAPVASGIVALMLQADPSLTPDSVKNILFATAIQDIYTGTLPSTGTDNWGHGKINAYAAVKRIAHDLGVYTYIGLPIDCTLFPNPGNGQFSLDYTGSGNDALTVSTFDITGKLISVNYWSTHAGLNRMQLNLKGAANGTYIVHVASENGSADIKAIVE